MRALFLLSTGRTGTTWLASVFEHGGARAEHEPDPRWLRMVGNAHAAGAVSRARAVDAVRRTRSEVMAASAAGNVPYVESNSLISGLAGAILDAFDDALVAQVVRAPEAYVRSAIAWGQYRFAGRALNVVPYRRLAAPQFRPWSAAERWRWAQKDQFERLCWTWTAQNAAMRQQGTGSERFRTLRFEDLVDPESGRNAIAGLFAELGLATQLLDPALAAAASDKNESASRAPKVELDDAQRRRLREVCGAEAAHYGYVV